MNSTEDSAKRSFNVIPPDSDDHEEVPKMKRQKVKPAAAPPTKVSPVTILHEALGSVLEAENPMTAHCIDYVSSMASSVSGESTSQLNGSSDGSLRRGNISIGQEISVILEASALLSNRMLKHPLSHPPRGLPAGKPLLAPPRLPQLKPGQPMLPTHLKEKA